MSPKTPSEPVALKRRSFFAGATTVGAVAAVAALLPTTPVPSADVAEPQRTPPARGGGYALSDHVKQYYQTTRV